MRRVAIVVEMIGGVGLSLIVAGPLAGQGPDLLALATLAPPATLAAAAAPAATAPAAAMPAATLGYAGRDADGVPHYIRRSFSADERELLRRVYGIEDPNRLYLSDSLPDAAIIYDTSRDRGHAHLVGSHRVGAPSVRREGESWEALERRLASGEPGAFPRSVARADTSLASLDSMAGPHFRRMLSDARRAGFRVRVAETRRSPERQAYIVTLSRHLTHTLTSRHTDGYAVDLVIDDGNLRRRRTRERWTEFRRWVAAYEAGRFRIIGTPERSWDWPHVELNRGRPGFRSVDELLEAARTAGRDEQGR